MIINSMIIIDVNKEEAREFVFSDSINLIVSQDNTQGKSSLIKSMYYALGYEIKTFPSDWDIKNICIQLQCDIDGDIYFISRKNTVFKIHGKDISETMSLRTFSDWLQDKLKIDMRLPNRRTQELHRAYASAVLLPFYIDQDTSWDGKLYCETATDINQYSNAPTRIMEYVLGLSSDEIQELTDEISKLKNEIQESNYIIKGLDRTILEYRESLKDTMIVSEIDKDKLKKEIEYYLSLINEYNIQITKHKVKILNKQKILNDQKQELAELNELLKMNNKQYKDIKRECRHCHSQLTVEQSLTRLQLSNEKLQIEYYREEIILEMKKTEEEISQLLDTNTTIFNEIERINDSIRECKNLLTIDEYIDFKSKSLALKGLENLREQEQKNKTQKEQSKKDLDQTLRNRKKTNKERRDQIVERYSSVLQDIKDDFLDEDITNLKCLNFKSINGSGMNRNKKYLACYLAYFDLLKEFSVYQLPICMDSFIKNEVSTESLKSMFKAIEDYFFSDYNQSFFSIIEENIKYLEQHKKYKRIDIGDRVLSKNLYNDVKQKLKDLEWK